MLLVFVVLQLTLFYHDYAEQKEGYEFYSIDTYYTYKSMVRCH